MPELSSKSPRTNYATRSAEDKPNIAYPDGALPVAGEEARAAVELADQEVLDDAVTSGDYTATLVLTCDGEATLAAIDPDASSLLTSADTIIDSDVSVGERAATKTAVHAVFTDAEIRAAFDTDALATSVEANTTFTAANGDEASAATLDTDDSAVTTDLATAFDATAIEAAIETAVLASVTDPGEQTDTITDLNSLVESNLHLTLPGADIETAAEANTTATFSGSSPSVSFSVER